jgi:hypothetical protein
MGDINELGIDRLSSLKGFIGMRRRSILVVGSGEGEFSRHIKEVLLPRIKELIGPSVSFFFVSIDGASSSGIEKMNKQFEIDGAYPVILIFKDGVRTMVIIPDENIDLEKIIENVK